MLSHNRLVFLTSFAILSMVAIGLETLLTGPVQWRWWFRMLVAVLVALGVWCIFCSQARPARFPARRLSTPTGHKYLDLPRLRRTCIRFSAGSSCISH